MHGENVGFDFKRRCNAERRREQSNRFAADMVGGKGAE